MNERIKELAEQADAYAKTEYEKWTPTPDFSGVPNIRSIYNQKFAELIVRECVSIVNSLEQYEGRGDCSTAEYIKEHFGVEE